MNKLVIRKKNNSILIKKCSAFLIFSTVSYQDLCFNMYEVELSNKQGEKIDKLTEVIKNKQLVRIINLKCNSFFLNENLLIIAVLD